MRIILDFQAAQSASRYRGIGRGSRSLMLAMAKRFVSRGHEIVCLVSEAFQEGLDVLTADILGQVPQAKLAVFSIPSPCAAAWPHNAWRQMAARILREYAIARLEPDFVHIPALLADGWGDDAVASVGLLGVHVPVSLTQHDLIPLVMADIYMPPGAFRDYYLAKLEDAKKADLFLAISEYSRGEVIEWLGVPEDRVVHISSAADRDFWQPATDASALSATMEKYGIRPGFLLYAPGGYDPRKNLARLFEAYSSLPTDVRSGHQLVLASMLDEGRRKNLEGLAGSFGLVPGEYVLTDYVSDFELKHLYSVCFAYIFPSLHEGFGLPALEAMCCGAPVIASACTSIPEVIGMGEALFDPEDVQSIAGKMLQVIQDVGFRQRLVEHSSVQPVLFSWVNSAEVAVTAMERRHRQLKEEGWQRVPATALPDCDDLLLRLRDLVSGCEPDEADISRFRQCFELNCR